MSIIERVNMKLRFVNTDPHKPISFNTHRGSSIRLAPLQSEDVNFGLQKEPQRAINYYAPYRNLKVVWLDRPHMEQSIQEDEKSKLEPGSDGKEDEDKLKDQSLNEGNDDSGKGNDDQGGSDDDHDDDDDDDKSDDEGGNDDDDSDDEDEDEEVTLTREEVEALGYKELVKYAKSKGVQAQKKTEILKELFGE